MFARQRLRMFALVCAATLAVGCDRAFAAFAVDTSRLPRISGSREVYASPASTSFITRESVTRAFEITATELINDDWQPFDDPSAARTSDASTRTMSFKKQGRALSLNVTIAPAQANATSVSYKEVALRYDLPFPKDATRINFDPERPYLSFVTAREPEATLNFFRNELRLLGWSLWSMRDGAAQTEGGIAGELTADGGHASYVSADNRRLMLTISRCNDLAFKVEIKGVPAGQTAGVPGKSAGGAQTAAAAQELVPVPHASEDIEFDGALGTLRFTSRASAGIIAEYYRSRLQQLGWQEKPSGIGNDQMVVLRFSSGANELAVAIMQGGARTRVTVEGSALNVAVAVSRSM